MCSQYPNPSLALALLLLLALTSTGNAVAQPGWVLSHHKISATAGGFSGRLPADDFFGTSVATGASTHVFSKPG